MIEGLSELPTKHRTTGKGQIKSTKNISFNKADLKKFDPTLDLSNFKNPSIDLLKDYGDGTIKIDQDELETNKNKIVDTLKNYNIGIKQIKATIGPTVTLYEIIPDAGGRRWYLGV